MKQRVGDFNGGYVMNIFGKVFGKISYYQTRDVSSFMGYLKGKSALMLFNKHANLKYQYGIEQIKCERE